MHDVDIKKPEDVWQILTVDSSPSGNAMTKKSLEHISFLGSTIAVLEASSIQHATQVLQNNASIAVVLLNAMADVHSEGLAFIHFIRTVLKNNRIRIILRTGYPDTLPDIKLIESYEIDGYISKEPMSGTQIIITIMTAIRAYYQIITTERVLQALAGSIAHEMRTPLSQANMSLNSIGELLPATDAPIPAALVPNIAHFVRMGKTSVERGHQVIDMILSALKSDVVDRSKFVPLSAAHTTQKAVDEYNFPERSARDKSNNLRDRVSVVMVKDFTFNGDETAYMFVLFNLMKNALYYFDQKPMATLVITVDDHQVTVRDTGPGMSKKVLSQLFTSFITSGKAEGTGLGLSYCKRAMQGFGGDITCDSVEGEFTQFTLTFPALTPEKSPNHENAEIAPLIDGNDEAIAAESALTGKIVILAEDNTNSREIVSWCLEGWGLKVLGAENGQKVLHYLEHAAHVDLILMDMDMPILNGVQTAGAIRSQRGAHQNVPILALTGNSDPASIKATITAGMNDFVVKTGDMKALREKILTFMQPNLPR